MGPLTDRQTDKTDHLMQAESTSKPQLRSADVYGPPQASNWKAKLNKRILTTLNHFLISADANYLHLLLSLVASSPR